MRSKNRALLTDGPIINTLLRLTIPMIFGIISIVIFNLVDTFFVGQLGTKELAALSFTFPVVLIIGSLALGLGTGMSAVVSKAIGEGNHHKVQRLTTDGLVLSFLTVVFFVTIGFFTIDPLFRLLGATPEVLPLIKSYMRIWYPGMIFVVVPMVGNSAIRATGDTKTPGIIMMIAALVNSVLDPLFIFGLGPFPKLGMSGAALATVIARSITFVISIYVLTHRERMITLKIVPFRTIFNSWKQIFYIGLPAAGTRIITPLGIGIITRLVASYGPKHVAAYGVSSRIEFFAITVVTAFAIVLGPFIGQNLGAKKIDRIKKGINYGKVFSMLWSMGMLIILFLFARPIASFFNKDLLVISTTVIYLRIVPIGYGLQGILLISTSVLNVLNKPFHASLLSLAHIFLIYIPLALIGSFLFGLPGIFAALAASYIISGIISHFFIKRILSAIK